MQTYFIQAKLNTMLQIHLSEDGLEHGFRFDGFSFETSKYDGATGRGDGTWVISKLVEAENYQAAITLFGTELVRIWSRIQFIGQAYCEPLVYATVLVQREPKLDGLGLLIHIRERGGTGLAFTDKSKRALGILCGDDSIPQNLFYYMAAGGQSNDLTIKMMTVFASLEVLFDKQPNDPEFFNKIDALYGKELKEKYWAPKGEGLRHRLTHGDYFDESDAELVYQDDVYRPLIKHFNENVFGEELISENVVGPQRTPWQNKVRGVTFLKLVEEKAEFIAINDVLDELDTSSGSYSFREDSQFAWADEPLEGEF